MMANTIRLDRHLSPRLFVAAALFLTIFFVLFEPMTQVVSVMSTPENNYGFLLIALAAFIFWRRQPVLVASHNGPDWLGLLFITAGIVLAAISELGYFVKLYYLSFVVIVFGFAITYFGRSTFRVLLAPCAVLLFAVPIPDYFTIQTSVSLQLVSSTLGTEILELFGVAVYRDGNIIDFGVYKLQVAEACSGLRYLLPLLLTSICLIWLARAPVWGKVLTVLFVPPLTIVLNSFRIAMTGLLVEADHVAAAEGFLHLFEGWLVFLVALVLLVGLLLTTTWLHSGRIHPADVLDFERIEGEALVAGRNCSGPRTLPSVLAPPMLVGLALVLSLAVATPALRVGDLLIPDRPSLLTFPLRIGDYVGVPGTVDETVLQQLKASDHLLVGYTNGDGHLVNFWVAYNNMQTPQRMLHSPKGCLPAGGWEYEWLRQRNVEVTTVGPDEDFRVNEAIVVKGAERLAMVYWMEARGRQLASETWNKVYNFYDALMLQRTDGALVRVFSPVDRFETDEKALSRVHDFIDEVYVHLEPHVD